MSHNGFSVILLARHEILWHQNLNVRNNHVQWGRFATKHFILTIHLESSVGWWKWDGKSTLSYWFQELNCTVNFWNIRATRNWVPRSNSPLLNVPWRTFRTLERYVMNLEGERTGFPWAHKGRSTETFLYTDFLGGGGFREASDSLYSETGEWWRDGRED
jgi:hypothetical protein